MLDYRNLAAQLYLHDARLNVSDQDVSLCFLPLSHVFERAWSFYVMHSGAQNVYLHDTNLVREAMQAVRPTMMCAVPRFYEKIFSAVQAKVAQAPGCVVNCSAGRYGAVSNVFCVSGRGVH